MNKKTAKPNEIKIIMKDYYKLLDHVKTYSNSEEIMNALMIIHAVYKTIFLTFKKEVNSDKTIDFVFNQIEIEKRKQIEAIE